MEQIHKPEDYDYQFENPNELYTHQELKRLREKEKLLILNHKPPTEYLELLNGTRVIGTLSSIDGFYGNNENLNRVIEHDESSLKYGHVIVNNEKIFREKGIILPESNLLTTGRTGSRKYTNVKYRNTQMLRKLKRTAQNLNIHNRNLIEYDITLASRLAQCDYLINFLETQPLSAGMKVKLQGLQGNEINHILTQNDMDTIYRAVIKKIQQMDEAADPPIIEDQYEKNYLCALKQIMRESRRNNREMERIEKELELLSDNEQHEFFNKIYEDIQRRNELSEQDQIDNIYNLLYVKNRQVSGYTPTERSRSRSPHRPSSTATIINFDNDESSFNFIESSI